MTELLVTARELGTYLCFSAATVVDWAEAGKIPAFRIGGRLRFRPSEVDAWLEGKRAGAGGEAPTTPREHPPNGVVSLVPTTPRRGGDD